MSQSEFERRFMRAPRRKPKIIGIDPGSPDRDKHVEIAMRATKIGYEIESFTVDGVTVPLKSLSKRP